MHRAQQASSSPLPILTLGDSRLETPCAPVPAWSSALQQDVDALHATLEDFRARHGFGRAIAAPQVGILRRIVAVNLGAGPITLINPQIAWRSDDLFEVWDDCLSIPDRIVRVRRHRSISLVYRDRSWRERSWTRLPEDLSELLQHEIDHLDGILMLARAAGEDAVRPIAEHAALVASARPRHRLSLAQIARAAESIDPVFRNTPQYECDALNQELGCRITLKVETVNPIRSFKGRGADFFMSEIARRGELRPIVCASAGNFGQALAYSARKHGRTVTVFASRYANAGKLAMMTRLGADLRLEGEDFDAAKAAARGFADATRGWMVEDGREAEITEGAGSIAVEMFPQGAAFDDFIAPLGNGALLNGCGRWIKAASPSTTVVGVCAAAADAMQRSFAAKHAIETETADTIADGIAVRVPVDVAVTDMQGIVDRVDCVTEGEIQQAMRLVYQTTGLLVEPSGAVGLATILVDRQRYANRRIAVVITGGHLAPDQLRQWLLDMSPGQVSQL